MFSKVLRFAHNLPTSMAMSVNTWIASPRPETCTSMPFGVWAQRISPPIRLSENDSSMKIAVAKEIMRPCRVLTI